MQEQTLRDERTIYMYRERGWFDYGGEFEMAFSMECTGVSPIIQWCLVRSSASSGKAEIARKAVVLRNTHNKEFYLRVWVFAIAVEGWIVILRNHSKVLVERLWYEGQLCLLLQRPGPATERWRACLPKGSGADSAWPYLGRTKLQVIACGIKGGNNHYPVILRKYEVSIWSVSLLSLTFVIAKGCWDPPELYFIVIDPLSY